MPFSGMPGAARSSGSGIKSRPLGRRIFAAATAAVLSVALAACSSSSDDSVSSGSGPDLAFFKGKTITYIIPNTPGSPPGLVVTAMKPALESYLGAKINIVYNTNVATVGEDMVGSAKPDGLTLGNLTPLVVLNQVYTNTGAPNFSLTDVSWIGATKTAPILQAGCKTSAFTTYAQLIQSQTPVKIVNIPTGATNEFNRLLMQIFTVPHQYLGGYTAATAIVGCQRGDGNYAGLGVSKALNAAGTAPAAGVTPLLLSSPMPDASPNAFLNTAVPTLADLAKQFPPSTDAGKQALQIATDTFNTDTPYYATFGPKGIAANRLLALRNAFQQATSTDAAQKAMLTAGVFPGFVDSTALLSFFTKALNNKAAVVTILNTN